MSLKIEVTKWNLELLPLFSSIFYILFSKALQKLIVFCYLCNDNNRLWKIILIQINLYSISCNLYLPRKIINRLVDSLLFCCLIDPILLFLIINALCKKNKCDPCEFTPWPPWIFQNLAQIVEAIQENPSNLIGTKSLFF